MECVCSLSSMHWEVILITLTILWQRQELANTCLDLNNICKSGLMNRMIEASDFCMLSSLV